MNHEINLQSEFGTHLSDGAAAYEFRVSSIDPYLGMSQCEEVVLDFSGVRSANSSFVNALVCGLIEQHGEEALEKLVFRGCLPAIQVLEPLGPWGAMVAELDAISELVNKISKVAASFIVSPSE